MITLNIARTPIGAVGRGFELTRRHGRTFDRWEAHIGEDVFVIIMPENEPPVPTKIRNGQTYTLARYDRPTFRAWYI